MPASQAGFGHFFLERNLSSMQAGYQLPVPGCPPGVQQSHLAAMAAGVPLAYSGLQGYNFIPYAHHRHIAHMNNAFDLKAASPYHHHAALLARGGAFYPPYRPGATPEDPSRVAKVATRESTGALKAWLNEHLKNPYPTKGEKIMLAIITKMSLTQVSTWFANARRRLKKENRVSWASKGKSDEEEEDEEEEEEQDGGESEEDDGSLQKSRLEEEIDPQTVEEEEGGDVGVCSEPVDARLEKAQHQSDDEEDSEMVALAEKADERSSPERTTTPARLESKDNVASQKPKIWSLAETATSETVKKPLGNTYHATHSDVGKLWADWATRNGLYVPQIL